MNSVNGIGPLVWQRLRASWRLLAVLSFGILVAATLLAVSPIYTRVMNDLGLEDSLREQIGSAGRNAVDRFGVPLGSAELVSEANRMAALVNGEIGWFTGGEARYGNVEGLTLGYDGQPLPTGQFRTYATLHGLSGFDDHAQVLDGRLPQPTSDPASIEVVLSQPAADLAGLRVGDRLIAGHTFDDCNRPPPTQDPEEAAARARFPCRPQTFVTLIATFTVVGIVAPTDQDEAFWSAGRFHFERPEVPENSGPTIPFLMPEQSFFQALPLSLPGFASHYRYTTFADISRLDSANLEEARASLRSLRAAEDSGLVPDLAMAAPLQEFSQRASFNQVTLLLLLLQVVGIAVYYVLLVASLLVERRAEETAVLRSRGATVGQLVVMSALEGAALALAAALVAPFLAAAVVSVLGKTGTFSDASGGDFLDYTVVPDAFLFALGGAGLAVIALVIPSFFAARRGLVLFLRGAARPGKPFLQRYYIDFGLAGLAAFALWELNQRGSVYDPRSVGGWSADPLLLLSPLFLILAVGALLFRFLPLILGIITRLLATTAGPGMALGLWQLTRSPARYTQLALLVVMAAAVGTFAATYSATTERSQTERALFQAGADVRTTGLGRLGLDSAASIREDLNAVPGVEESAAAYRGSLSLGPLPLAQDFVEVLGVDPTVAADLLWFRPDFAPGDLGTAVRRLSGSPAGGAGLLLQGEPVGISLWAGPTNARDVMTIWLRTVDADGIFRLHELGTMDYEGYRRLETRFSRERDGIAYPLSIAGIVFTQGQSANDPARGSLLVDDIATIDADGTETVVEDFEGPFRWDSIRTATRNRDIVVRSDQNQYRGTAAASFNFRVGSGVPIRGMIVADPNIPLPAIASSRLLERTGGSVGEEVELIVGSVTVPLSIQAEAHLFPSLPDSSQGFVIVNQDHLFFYTGLTNQATPSRSTEAWLRLSDDPATRQAAFNEIGARHGILHAQFLDVQRALEESATDPIIKAGGSGVLLIALIAAFAILALGFVLTLYLGGQGRTIEVSVLRAVGLSPRQTFAMISLEYLLVAVVGLIVGTLAGLRISATMLSFLNVTEQGARIVPPFYLVTSWDTVAIAFAATGIAFVAGVIALAVYFLRLPVSRILRLTR
jgi:ABC-type antimicrobial peptide transport system permease subunit